MRNNSVIRYLLGVLMLFLFGFSVTPKKILHDIFANHKDNAHRTDEVSFQQLNQTRFNCDTDNLVVESAFTEHDYSIDIAAPVAVAIRQSIACYHFYSSSLFFFELRGPPAFAC